MNTIHVIIIEDEYRCTELLIHLLQRYHQDVVVLGSADSIHTGLSLIKQHQKQLDLLFLDIQMPGGDGFTLLQNIPDLPVKVVFTTAYDHYALRAIKFSALEYLLKPLDAQELSIALDKFRDDRAKKMPISNNLSRFKSNLGNQKIFEKLAIATLTDIRFIHLSQVTYLESDNNYSTIYLEDNERIVSSKNIGYYEELLRESSFFRVNNSNLVNSKKIVRFIKGKTGSVELENGKTLLVSSSKKEALLKSLELG
jgi:two-component system LytT family response regulator